MTTAVADMWDDGNGIKGKRAETATEKHCGRDVGQQGHQKLRDRNSEIEAREKERRGDEGVGGKLSLLGE